MALADKKYTRVYDAGGSSNDALSPANKTEYERRFNDKEYLEDESFREAFGVILYAIQSLSEDIDEIRRFTYTSTAAGDLGAVLASNSKVTAAVSANNAATGLHNSLAGHQHITDTSVIGEGYYWIHSRDISDLTANEKSTYGHESYGLNIYTGEGEGSWWDFNQTLVPDDNINRNSGEIKIYSGNLLNSGSGESVTGVITVMTGLINYSPYSTALTLTCSASDDSDTVTHSATGSGNQVIPGATVTGTGIDSNTTVVSVAANRESFTISKNTTAAISGGTLTFSSGQYNNGTNVPVGSGDVRSGDLNLQTGWVKAGSGDATTGDIDISTGQSITSSGTATRGSVTLDGSVVIVEPKLKIKGNAIQDNDGVDCITFDSSGNTTITNTLNASLTGNVTGDASGSSGSCTGNAATATKLAASKNIGGVAFDGSLDINLPGVNTAGDQNTTGNAATATTATTATALASGNQTINGDLTVTSGAAGDARLIISSDTNDNPAHETYNPQLWFKQDGDITAGAVQLINNKLQIISNETTLGGISFLTGTTNNTSATDPSTGATEKMAISPDGVVSIHGVAEVGTRDGDDYLQIARYSSASPYALISCGEPGNVNTNVGLKVTRKNGSGANVDCLTIEGSNGDTTISGALTATGGITNAGTISAGTWNGSAIASNKLDPDTAHLSGIQTFLGPKTFEAGIVLDGDRSATPGDGAMMHVDAADITDNNTSASGTAIAYNHVSIENPRILASNALVTTTDASTLQIKGAPVASTNQTITNAWALKVTAGNCKFGGDLDVVGNVLPGITYVKILPSDFIPDDAGRPIMIDDTTSGRWLESHTTAKMFASVQIPIGFKATHVDIYGDSTSQITVYEADIDSAVVTSKGTGSIGTQIDITDVTADATNYILIQLAQASGEKVYGGKLTIAKA